MKIDPLWQVPVHTIAEFMPKRHNYAMCVFVINEGENLLRQLSEMVPLAKLLDIIIADGGSTDGSTARDTLIRLDVRTLLTKTDAGKLSAQMRMAFAYCLEQGYEGIITVDGNHKDDTSAAPMFMAKLQDGYDHVQGSRFVPGGKAINTPLIRWLGLRVIHAPLISLASGFHYTDTTNGFRAYSFRLLIDPGVQPFRDVFETYELHYYLAIRAAELGFKVIEIPVTRVYPSNGKLPTKITPISGNFRILNILLRTVTHQYNP